MYSADAQFKLTPYGRGTLYRRNSFPQVVVQRWLLELRIQMNNQDRFCKEKRRAALPTSFSSDRILRDLSSSLLVQKGRKDKREKLPLYCVLQTLAMHRHGRPLSVSEIPSASVFQFPNKVSMNVTDDTGISLVCLCREIKDDGCFLCRRR